MAYTTIDNPTDYFTTVLSTSTGSALTIDTGFKPDWLWTKARNFARSHEIHDTSRGDNKRLKSDANTAEESYSNYLAFTSTGATFGTNHNLGYHTEGATTGVSWAWKANGGTETHSQAESGSNIACSVSANTTAGFSIITYTGTGGTGHTFLHGLGSAPAWFIIKRRSGTEDWAGYHHKNTSQPETDHLLLNTTAATDDSETRFDDTAPNGTEIALGNNAVGNADGSTYVCYAFKEIQGYSKFGSYTGNGNADGAFVYTGFKPAWLMYKQTNAGTRDWIIVDNKRDIFNVCDEELYANENDATGDVDLLDFVSNGFKCRRSHNSQNGNGDTYIYMAFAEHPFVSSEGVPTTAR